MKCSFQLPSSATAALPSLLLLVQIAISPGYAQETDHNYFKIGERTVEYRSTPSTFWGAYHECRRENQYLFMPKTQDEIQRMKTFLSSRGIANEVYVSGTAIRGPYLAMPSGDPLAGIINPTKDKDSNFYLMFTVGSGKINNCDGADDFSYFCEKQLKTNSIWDDIIDMVVNFKKSAIECLN